MAWTDFILSEHFIPGVCLDQLFHPMVAIVGSTDVRIDFVSYGICPAKANLASADVSEDGTLGITWIDSQK